MSDDEDDSIANRPGPSVCILYSNLCLTINKPEICWFLIWWKWDTDVLILPVWECVWITFISKDTIYMYQYHKIPGNQQQGKYKVCSPFYETCS